MTMTKEEFESHIMQNILKKMTKEDFDRWYSIQPCDCGEDNCKGWAIGPHENEFEGKP